MIEFKHRTILITGGSSGIGLELTRQLLRKSNRVIICARTEEKLQQVKDCYPEVHTFRCDISDPLQCDHLADYIACEHPDCNVLINNAAVAHRTSFLESDYALQQAEAEISTNFLAPLRLIHRLVPIIQQNTTPQIINVGTGLIYAPRAIYSFYNATKAALHAFTQVLRLQLEASPIVVTEVMFPAVDTPWHQGNPPKIAIRPEKAVKEMIRGIEKGQPEVRVAGAKLLYILSRIAPYFALKKVNQL